MKLVAITIDVALFGEQNDSPTGPAEDCCGPVNQSAYPCDLERPVQATLRRPLRDFVINRIKERFLRDGRYTESQIDQAIELLESERPILDWLMNGGFEAILKFIAAILAMFG